MGVNNMFFNEQPDVEIMTGEIQDLKCVCSSLHMCGIAASIKEIKSGINGSYPVLLAPAKDKDKARFVAREYLARCKAFHGMVKLNVKEINTSPVEDETNSNIG